VLPASIYFRRDLAGEPFPVIHPAFGDNGALQNLVQFRVFLHWAALALTWSFNKRLTLPPAPNSRPEPLDSEQPSAAGNNGPPKPGSSEPAAANPNVPAFGKPSIRIVLHFLFQYNRAPERNLSKKV
jgi:hypothetical protein